MPRSRMKRPKNDVMAQDLASGNTSDSVSWPDFQLTVEEKIETLERRMRVHESKCNKNIEEISRRVFNITDIDEMSEIVSKVKGMGDRYRDDDELQTQIDEIKKTIDSKCHCNHVDYVIRQMGELDHFATDSTREDELFRTFIDARAVAIENYMEPWKRQGERPKWSKWTTTIKKTERQTTGAVITTFHPKR